jgi:RNA polymerase sigma-70 factor (ECF subfamily)
MRLNGEIMDNLDFSKVYNDSKTNVWNLVSKFVFSQQDREDLFQEVFVSIHKGLKNFRGDSSLSTWIYRVASNTAINHVNKKNRYKSLLNLLHLQRNDEASEPRDHSAGLEDLEPLKILNPKQRMILILADVEEKKLDEISEIMKIPSGTVKSNLFRAREIIKKEVVKNGGI